MPEAGSKGEVAASTARARAQLGAAACLAGAAGLAYELSWTRLLGLSLGHEQLGVLAVLAGFFGGMALGAWLAHGRADRLRRPARVFGLLQLIAAGFAVLAPHLSISLVRWLPGLLGVGLAPARSLAIAAVLLLPATLALGASLPVLIAARRGISRDDARGIARFYALDTLGATLGVLLTIHLVLPRLGFVVGALVCAALGVAAAAMAWLASSASDDGASELRPASEHPAVGAAGDPDTQLLGERWLLYVAIAATGLLGLGLELVGVRVLSQVLSGTIYSFADLLAVWLLGTTVGTAAYARLSTRALSKRPATVLVALFVALAITTSLCALLAKAAPGLLSALAPEQAGWGRRQLAELLVAALVLGPATFVMGACFAHLLALIAAPGKDAAGRPGAIGGALAINGLAAAAAPFVFGLAILGHRTYAEAWAIIAWAYLIVGLAIAWLRRFPPRQIAIGAIGGGMAVLSCSAAAGSLVLIDEDPQWTVLERREAALGVVEVSRSTAPPGSPEHPLLRLRVDRHFRMGGALSIGERRMGHLPLLLAGALEGAEVLFLGVGTGATAGAALAHPVAGVRAVELVPEVVEMLPYFEEVNGGLAEDPRATVLAADARRFLLADRGRYAVIVADLFHPARDGAGSLYAREHFEAARERLAPGGLFALWLPLYQLDFASVRLIVRTFVEVYPEAHAILALYNARTPALGLIGSVEPIRVDLERLRTSLGAAERREEYTELALLDPRDVLAGYMLDREGLVELAGPGPINDDLHPMLELWAPRAQLGPLTGAENLERLLEGRQTWPDGLVEADDPAELERYREASRGFAEALGHYLRGEIELQRRLVEGAPVMTREVLEHHLAAYQGEPEFLPARPRLYAAAEGDPALAEWLLPAMLERTPEEPRVHRAWLAHLARLGDRARFDEAVEQAEPILRRAPSGGRF